MTDLTTTPEGQSTDPMDSDSDTGDIRPDPKRPRTRRRRWFLLAAIPVMLLTLMVCAAATLPGGGCTLEGIIPEPVNGVSFELTPFLADAAMPVHVRACVRERYSTLRFAMPKPPSSCTSVTVYALWDRVFIRDPPLTWEQPIAVRLTMKDQPGNSILDSSAVVQPYTVSYEPSCYGVIDVATVVATRPGRLAPYRV